MALGGFIFKKLYDEKADMGVNGSKNVGLCLLYLFSDVYNCNCGKWRI